MAEQTLSTPIKQWARSYETIYILRPNIEPEDAEKVAARVTDVFEKMGGKLTKVDLWGKRKLAYPIRKYTRGIFIFLGYSAHGDLIAELERNLRLLETVIRFQTVVLPGELDLETVTIDAEETVFTPLEDDEEEEEELTTAQRLGMEEARPRPAPVEAKEEGEDGDEAKADAKADDAEAKTDGTEAKADDATEAKADDATAAKAETKEGDDGETDAPVKSDKGGDDE